RRVIHTMISSSNGVECSTKNLEDIIYLLEVLAEEPIIHNPDGYEIKRIDLDGKATLLQEVLHHVTDNIRTVLDYIKGTGLIDFLYLKQLVFLKDGLHTITLPINDLPKLKGDLNYLESIFLTAHTAEIDWSKLIDTIEEYQNILLVSEKMKNFDQILDTYIKVAC
ncbi:TPA: hypothetical protein ACN9OB_002947, partial [Listeria monocytogenes]